MTDEQGQKVWSAEYTPFGGITIPEGNLKRARKFTGKDLDEDTGLYYFNARWYDQEIGRFISVDPAKDGLNWYTYANNNPLLFVDPSGLAAFTIKHKYRGQDVYDYMALSRGGEFSHNLIGFIPGAGFVSWVAKNTGGITEKNWRDHLLTAGPNLGDLASMAKHFKNIPRGSKISKVGAKFQQV